MGGNPIRHHGDAVRLGPAGESTEGKPGLGWQRILERDDAGQHAAVELGQYHMHGKIGGAEAAWAVAPCRTLGDGADDLEHRDARRVERRRFVGAAASGKGGHGDDQRRLEPLERLVQKRARLAILQAGDEQRGRGQAACGERRAERIDRRGVVGEQQGAVEDDRHDRMAGLQRRRQAIEVHRALAREIAGKARHRLRLAKVELMSGVMRQPAQQRP